MATQIDRTEELQQSNFKMFLSTVRSLASAQGFYSRMQRTIDEWTDEQYNEAREYFNSLPQKFNDTLDVVLFLEQ